MVAGLYMPAIAALVVGRAADVYMPAMTALVVGRIATEGAYPVASQDEAVDASHDEAVDRVAGVYMPATAALVEEASEVNPHLETQYAIPVRRL